MSERIPITGPNRVIELLETAPQLVDEVIVEASVRGDWTDRLKSLCREHGVGLQERTRDELRQDRRIPRDMRQVLAWFSYHEESDVRDLVGVTPGDRAVILALDGLQDPGNLGAILRSAAWFGVRDVVLPKRRAAPITGTVAARSAGALAHLRIHRVTNLSRALNELRDGGYWIIGSVVDEGESLVEADLSGPAVLVLGGEEKGLRPGIRKACDRLVTLPPAGGIGSLNVSVFAGLFLYEKWKS
jgi:23S rRNA (guanosine2251-2'-O)-methyltransferase